jgi:galactokinase
VLPAPLERDTRGALRPRTDGWVHGASRERGAAEAPLEAPPRSDWLDYPRGIAETLAEAGWIPRRGFDLEVESDLPQGAGLSSSAALLAATALALLGAAGRELCDEERPELARLCQRRPSSWAFPRADGSVCGVLAREPGSAPGSTVPRRRRARPRCPSH